MNEYERPHRDDAVFLTSFLEEYSFLTPEAPVNGERTVWEYVDVAHGLRAI
jgi:hypothetical protein